MGVITFVGKVLLHLWAIITFVGVTGGKWYVCPPPQYLHWRGDCPPPPPPGSTPLFNKSKIRERITSMKEVSYIFHVVLYTILCQIAWSLGPVEILCCLKIGPLKVLFVDLKPILAVQTQVYWKDNKNNYRNFTNVEGVKGSTQWQNNAFLHPRTHCL